jgi:hypothetical protein
MCIKYVCIHHTIAIGCITIVKMCIFLCLADRSCEQQTLNKGKKRGYKLLAILLGRRVVSSEVD